VQTVTYTHMLFQGLTIQEHVMHIIGMGLHNQINT